MNVLGWQNLYHPDHRDRRLWARMYKVASTSLLFSAFNHGWGPITPDQARQYLDYYLIAFVRHPLTRCVSHYRDGQRGMTFQAYVERVLEDAFDNNPHCLPQSELLIREPDFLGRFENLADDYERLQGVIGRRWPLQHKNQSGQAMTQGTPKELIDGLPNMLRDDLISFYEPDFERFCYDRTSY